MESTIQIKEIEKLFFWNIHNTILSLGFELSKKIKALEDCGGIIVITFSLFNASNLFAFGHGFPVNVNFDFQSYYTGDSYQKFSALIYVGLGKSKYIVFPEGEKPIEGTKQEILEKIFEKFKENYMK